MVVLGYSVRRRLVNDAMLRGSGSRSCVLRYFRHSYRLTGYFSYLQALWFATEEGGLLVITHDARIILGSFGR